MYNDVWLLKSIFAFFVAFFIVIPLISIFIARVSLLIVKKTETKPIKKRRTGS